MNVDINCNCLHPGFVNSNFGNNNSSTYRFFVNIAKNLFAISNDRAAELPVYLALSKDIKDITGKYFVNFKIKKSSKMSYDIALADQVWDKSLKYIK